MAAAASIDPIIGIVGIEIENLFHSHRLIRGAAYPHSRNAASWMFGYACGSTMYDLLSEDARADVRAFCESIAAVSHVLEQRDPLRRHHCTAEALAYLRRSAIEDRFISPPADLIM